MRIGTFARNARYSRDMVQPDAKQIGQRDRGASESPQSSVCICIATCRRPEHLRKTLMSLAGLDMSARPNDTVRIVIVENDVEASSEPVIDGLRSTIPWPVEYAVESRPGISFARNTLVQLAGDSDFIAFMDDDEVAESNWLTALLATRQTTGADAVLGPVLPRFEAPTPAWLVPFFDRRRAKDQAEVDARDFRSGNVLVTVEALRTIEGPFDPAFALTGGSDGFLGQLLEAGGARFFWSDEAIVHETIPADRARVSWLLRRHFRTGMALAIIRIRIEGRLFGTLHCLTKGFGAVFLGMLSTTKGLVAGRRGLLEGLVLAASGAGSLFALIGGRFQEYGSVHNNPSPLNTP